MSEIDHARTGDRQLFWEPLSEANWGRYLTEVENRHIQFAHQLCDVPSSALEIGAEGGRWSKLLAELGWKMTCTDVVPAALEVCQQRIPDATCICVDPTSEEIPVESHSQRLILCIEVNAVMEQDWFIDEVERALQPGGVVVGVFHNRNSIRGIFKSWFPAPGDQLPQYTVAYRPWRQKMTSRSFVFHREEGLCWMPFRRRSNSRLIPLATTIERLIGLRRLPGISPWIVLVAQKADLPF